MMKDMYTYSKQNISVMKIENVLCMTSRAVIAQWLERLHADPVVMYHFTVESDLKKIDLGSQFAIALIGYKEKVMDSNID